VTTPYGGGFLGNLLGGAAGTLAGTSTLQSSVDQLTNAVNRLTAAVGTGTLGAGTASYGSQQQRAANAGGFPPVNTPGMTRQAGIGGGGPGGAGNVATPMPFSRLGVGLAGGAMIGSAFANYGQGMMPFQLGLNAYASMSMMGMSGMNSGMGNYAPTFSQLSNQPGIPLTASPMDYLGMTQQLSFLGGAPNYMSTSLGRAGFGAAAAFGMTNPTLSGASSANLAQQIYNPQLSMRMRALGYNMTPRAMGSGMPQNLGNVTSSLLQGWYGRGKVNPAQLYKTLSFGGKGFTNLQYLGLNPQQMAPMMEGFNQLFNAGYSPQQASTLFSQAASNNPTIAAKAQNTLTQHGVRSVSSDIQKMKNNQGQVTQRDINTAPGFNAALTSATGSLKEFNSALNSILTNLHLNGALGAAGGFMGTLSGTSHGNIMQGLGGLGLLGLAFRGSGAGGALGSIGARLGIGGAGAGAGGMAAALGPIGVGLGLGATLKALGDTISPAGTNAGRMSNAMQNSGILGSISGAPITGGFMGWLATHLGFGGGTTSRVGGGSGSSVPSSRQQTSKTTAMTTSGASSSAIRAVDMAESQIGVPYVWGGEQPGVGFDCSGLVQWAYKQAGVNLPRTSEEQWASLKRKVVNKSQVQAGDIVFAAGSDGTPTNPGHEGLMINSRQLIQAPFTGEDVQIIGYDPKAWIGAARPTGKGNFGISNVLQGPSGAPSAAAGNSGAGMGLGNYGSVNEVDIVNSMGAGGGLGGAGLSAYGGGLNSLGASKMGGSTSAPKSLKGLQAAAMQLLRAKGWGNQYGALNNIIMRESGWRVNATNQGSGAYGIPQALPGSKMSAAGPDWRTDGLTQLKWMIDDYIGPRYGNPNNAWQFWQQNGYYATGGKTVPGMAWVGERGPELITTGGGNTILNNAQSMALMKSINQTAQSPWKNITDTNSSGGNVIHAGHSGGAGVVVNFAANSICVTLPAGSDSQSAGRAIAQSVVDHIGKEDIWNTIAMGIKN
jgi:cell wall-associated NlpC family hydrolase